MQPTALARLRIEGPPGESPVPARRPPPDTHWEQRLYDVRPSNGPTFLKKKTWDPEKVAEWRRNNMYRSMPTKDVEPRPPRPLRIPPEVEGHAIYRGPPDCDVGERMLDPDVIKALKRSSMHPDLIKQWLERYCYDLTDEWLETWLEAWEAEGEDEDSDEDDCGEQPVGGARLPRATGRHRALLVGCAYAGTPLQLKCPVNDARYLATFLSRYGYRPRHTTVLADDGEHTPPTRDNLIDALRDLVAGAKAGDSLFFFFSGYGRGNRLPGDSETYLDGTTLCPADWQDSGLLEDDVLYELLVYPLPRGVKLTCVLDCHRHSCGLDLPFEYEQVSGGLVCTNPVDLIKADVICFSGAVNVQLPGPTHVAPGLLKGNDRKPEAGEARSPMLKAFLHAVHHAPHNPPTIYDVIQGMRNFIGTNCAQLPTLSASRGYTLIQPFVP